MSSYQHYDLLEHNYSTRDPTCKPIAVSGVYCRLCYILLN